jgi:hypothetical protein
MRDNAMLDTSALRCLPIESEKFPEGAMFAPFFETVKSALLNEQLLPRFDSGFVSGNQAKLARTQELRELFSPDQIEALFGSQASAWVTGDITPDRQPVIRAYLMQELGVTEVTPATLVPRFTKDFLEAQTNDWVRRLYEFLNGQEAALRRSLDKIPLIRLDDGTHVVARENGTAQAFLPSAIKSDFPIVRSAVCESADARNFLIALGVTEPDQVDDVVLNLLPKYRQSKISLDDYTADIERIRQAFKTDSAVQREKLRTALRDTTFVAAVGTGDGKRYVAKPSSIYIATDRLKQLYANVPGVFIVNDEYDCLRGEEMRELLEACGALRYPRPEKAPIERHWSERLKALRVQAGHPQSSGYSDRVEDWTLQGFQDLLDLLPKLSTEQRVDRARLIWESLGDLEERRGRGIFDGSYTWTHNGSYATSFPAAFLRALNAAAWVPNANGELVPPNLVVFDTLGWKPNPFLLTKVAFKPPIIDQLAAAAGIDPAALDLLRKLGITSVVDLISRLGIGAQPPEEEETSVGNELSDEKAVDEMLNTQSPNDDVYKEARDLYGTDMPNIPPGTPDPDGGDGVTQGGPSGAGIGSPRGGGHLNGGAHGDADGRARGGTYGGASSNGGQGKRTPGSTGGRPFISYLGAHRDDEESDPDGLDQSERMQIEESAINLIIALEPALHRTAVNNAGFDLYETNASGTVVRWVEVKSMTGSLKDRPVGLSRPQFEFGRSKGGAFWLYVVENASDPKGAKVLKIQNPVGNTRTFTFDHGWASMSSSEDQSESNASPEAS